MDRIRLLKERCVVLAKRPIYRGAAGAADHMPKAKSRNGNRHFL